MPRKTKAIDTIFDERSGLSADLYLDKQTMEFYSDAPMLQSEIRSRDGAQIRELIRQRLNELGAMQWLDCIEVDFNSDPSANAFSVSNMAAGVTLHVERKWFSPRVPPLGPRQADYKAAAYVDPFATLSGHGKEPRDRRAELSKGFYWEETWGEFRLPFLRPDSTHVGGHLNTQIVMAYSDDLWATLSARVRTLTTYHADLRALLFDLAK